jgi:hypothetical protein
VDFFICDVADAVLKDLILSMEHPSYALSKKPETYERAGAAASGWDVRVLEQEWRSWAGEVPKSADVTFVGFCKKRFAEKGRP